MSPTPQGSRGNLLHFCYLCLIDWEIYDNRFLEFLKAGGPKICAQIRYIRILAHSNLSFELVTYLAAEMPHVKLTYVLPEHIVKDRIKL